jgi:hypothetical protein
MGRSTREELERRREAVELAILERPWTVRTQSQIGKEYGVTAREIRADALIIRNRWADEAKETGLDAGRADWLHRLRAAQDHALAQNQSIAVARLMGLEARACGYEAAIEVNVSHTAETMSPVDQARAIVEHYEAAKIYLETVSPAPRAIEAEFKCVDTAHETGRSQK